MAVLQILCLTNYMTNRVVRSFLNNFLTCFFAFNLSGPYSYLKNKVASLNSFQAKFIRSRKAQNAWHRKIIVVSLHP